jgi:hypothetical protein
MIDNTQNYNATNFDDIRRKMLDLEMIFEYIKEKALENITNTREELIKGIIDIRI